MTHAREDLAAVLGGVMSNLDNSTSLCVHGHVVPTLFIIGCMKCATTSLHHALLMSAADSAILEGTCPGGLSRFQCTYRTKVRTSARARRGRRNAARAHASERASRARRSREQEKHFFDNDQYYAQGFKAYAELYPSCTERESGARGARAARALSWLAGRKRRDADATPAGAAARPPPPLRVAVDASPSYIRHPTVPARIVACYGAARIAARVRFVAVLREPVSRLFSQYHMTHNGKAAGPFEPWAAEQLALAAEYFRATGGAADAARAGRFDMASVFAFNNRGRAIGARSRARRGLRAGNRGRAKAAPAAAPRGEMQLQWSAYAYQLRHWLAHVPAERLVVASFSRFRADPQRVQRELLGLLGVSANGTALDAHDPAAEKRNSYSANRTLDPAVRARLEAFYEPHNRELFELIRSSGVRVLPRLRQGEEFAF